MQSRGDGGGTGPQQEPCGRTHAARARASPCAPRAPAARAPAPAL